MTENEIAKIVVDVAASSLLFSIFAASRLCAFASTDVRVVGPLCPSWNPDLLFGGCQLFSSANPPHGAPGCSQAPSTAHAMARNARRGISG
jgi:hypothetical protein